MISLIELLRLALEGSNIESGEYKVISTKYVRGRNVSFKILLSDLLEHDTNFEDIHACVGSINHCGEVGYLVKIVNTIPTVHNLLGAVDAIYEVGVAEGENLYYAVWVITGK